MLSPQLPKKKYAKFSDSRSVEAFSTRQYFVNMSGRALLLLTVSMNIIQTPATPSKQEAFYYFRLLNKTSAAETIEDLTTTSGSMDIQNNPSLVDRTPKIVTLIVIGCNVCIGFFYRVLLIKNVWKSGSGGPPPISVMTGEKDCKCTSTI